jgi:hypothetical protein
MTTCITTPTTDVGLMFTVLPGPDRQRSPQVYHFRSRYRAEHAAAIGCVASWDVIGGRQDYQIALERDDAGSLRWHCTCADAVYRSETEAGHVCKHVRALRAFVPPVDAA